MKVLPFYSAAPADSDIYHMPSDCHIGRQIPAKHRREEKRNRFRCYQCAALLDGHRYRGVMRVVLRRLARR